MTPKDQAELKCKEEHAQRLALHALRMEAHAAYFEQCGLRTEEHKEEIESSAHRVDVRGLDSTSSMTAAQVAARKRSQAFVRHIELTQQAEAWKDAARARQEETAAWKDFFALRRRLEEQEKLAKLTEAWRDGRTDEEIQSSLGTVPCAAPTDKKAEPVPWYLSTDRDDGLFSGTFTLGDVLFSFKDATAAHLVEVVNAKSSGYHLEVVENDGREQIKISIWRPTVVVVDV